MHGYDHMDGLHPTTFIHPNSHHLFEAYTQTVREGREFRSRAQDVRRDGSIFDVEVIGRSFLYGGRPAILGVVRDVTDQVRAYQLLERRVAERTREIERRREVAEGLRDLLAAVNSLGTLDEILEYVVAQSRQLLGSDASAILLPADGPDSDVLIIRASSNLEEPFRQVRLPVEMSSTGLAYKRLRPVIVPDVPGSLPSTSNQEFAFDDYPTHTIVHRLPAVLDEPSVTSGGVQLRGFASGYGAMLAVPLAVKEERYGALALYFRESRDFSADDIDLASAFADQTALALENARLRVQAEQAAAVEERQRLARELHDAVTQTLFSASLVADVVPELWDVDPDEARRRLEQLRRLTRGALAEMRLLLVELRPHVLADLSLTDLLRQLADAAAGSTGADVDVRFEGPSPMRLPPDVHVALYRIAQEALNNISKHASASNVSLTLRHQPDCDIILEISDDGRGFDPAVVAPGHLGLGIMRERAQDIGAAFKVESRAGKGTRIEIVWRDGEGPAE
jgi:signal transduction histidine kinase